MTEIHAQSPNEHAVCGLAFDAFDSGDADEPVVFAQPGETVTCAICRQHIAHVFECFTRGYRVRKLLEANS